MHLTDADIGTALDPANDGARGVFAHAHAETCADCRRAIRQARAADREVTDLLHLLDHATPAPDFASLQRRAGALDPAGRRARQPAHVWTVVRRSVVILGLSAAAAAALPPMRQFIVHSFGARRVAQPAPAPGVRATTPPVAQATIAPRGVAIVPDGRVDLIFRSAQPGGVLHIRTVAGPRVAVTASADSVRYIVGRGRIVVDTRATGVTYDIALPAPPDLLDVSIRIGDREVFSRHGAIVQTRGALEADGSYRILASPDDSTNP